MRINYLSLLIALAIQLNSIHAQTMQIKFCGKTSPVVPAKDNSGNDQRHKGGLRMDLIRIGKLSQSRTVPFYSLGINPLSFMNGTWVDGCANNTNQFVCSGCTTCKIILSTTNSPVGVSEGKMEGNVRMRTANNDLFIESTGSQAVVCFTTNPIDLSNQQGKKIEVNVIYEGTSQDGFATANVNFSYKYNGGAWNQLLNQNSNFLRVIDTAILITVNVPTAVENLDGIVDFEISPNPVNEKLFIEMNSQITFNGLLSIRDILGRILFEKDLFIQEGNNRLNVNTQELQQGVYLLQIGDQEGRVSTKKFVKE